MPLPLTVSQVSVPFPAVWSDAERAQRQSELARGEDYSDRDFQQTAAKLRKLAAAAKKVGVDLSIELHDDGMTDQSSHVMRLHGLVDRPNVGVNPDLQNGYRVPYPTESWRTAVERMAAATFPRYGEKGQKVAQRLSFHC